MNKLSTLTFCWRWILIFLAGGILIACSRDKHRVTIQHYSEDFLAVLTKMSADQESRTNAINSLDSFYNTFPSVSAADKYRYYDFKRNLFELIRHGDKSYDTAIAYIDSMISVIEEQGLQKEMSNEYIRAFKIRSDYFTRRLLYNDAIVDINRIKLLNKEAGDSCMIGENTRTLGLIAIRQSNFQLAASLLKEAIMFASTCENNKEQFVRMQRWLDDLGYVYANTRQYDSSLFYHFTAERYILENKENHKADTIFPYIALSNVYGNIGVTYEKLTNYREAEAYLNKAIMIINNYTHQATELAKLQVGLGRILLQQGRITEAEDVADKAFSNINKLSLFFKSSFYKLKADIAKARKEYKKEATYRESYQLTQDSINTERIELFKKNPFAEYERLDKKYQLDLLEKDNRNQRNKATSAIIIGTLLILATVFVIYTLRRIRNIMKKRAVIYKQLVQREKDLKRTMDEKEIAEKQLRENELLNQEMQLQMKFNEAIIQQRSQISDDMHDELSSSLAALKFYVEDVKKKSAGTSSEKSLADISAEVNAVYTNARSYMHSLKTNQGEQRFNLAGFLQEIRQKFAEKNLMDVIVSVDEDKIRSQLSTHQHDQLYHICSEAITNIIKHAAATCIEISIEFKVDTCYFIIKDNGEGFKTDAIKRKEGVGLKSIQKRMTDLDGVLVVNTGAAGTALSGNFPIHL